MGTVLVGLALLVAGGLGAFAASSRPRFATWLGAGGCVAGCALGLLGAAWTLAGASSDAVSSFPTLRRPWEVPYGEFALAMDPLSAFFLIIVFALCLAAAVYGSAYLAHHGDRRRAARSWFFFNLLAAGMAMVVLARNGVLFLVAWEVMALASFALVSFEDDKAAVRSAGRLYLVATHTGTAFLLAFFVGLAGLTSTMDFDRWGAAAGAPPASAGLFFLLALVGFGTKAGLVPFHVWLPEAHPAAPSHVSAVMSGAMIPMGLYGLMRTLTFLGPPPMWWGATMLGVGVASAVIGVLFALAQQDIKRLLAYSSVENSGLIAIGLGIGSIGLSRGQPAMTALGFAGALLHALNHSLFKGLLFFGAGAVVQGAGTRQIGRLGGLLKTMPITGLCFFVGAAAISGMPPLNGFIGEFLLLLGSFHGAMALQGADALLPVAALVGLALAGGLAAACFLRLFGTTFLGTPRTGAPASLRDATPAMRAPMIAMASLCAVMGLVPALALPALGRAASVVAGPSAAVALATTPGVAALSGRVPLLSGFLLGSIAALAWLRWRLLSRREVRPAVTWDCGYESPGPRMQYTASSFGEPLRDLFGLLAPVRRRIERPEGHFPARASFQSEIVRPYQEGLYRPAFEAITRGMSRLRWLHHGRVQLYVLYIVVTLIAMLAWLLSFQVAR